MTVKNLSASVQARLQNHARATNRPFQELLQYYAMERFLYRVQYTYPDGTSAYEPVCVRAVDDDVTAALAEVDGATQRYPLAVGATKTLTLVLVTADA